MSINGAETTALVDSGSMITTISEEFYKTLSPLPKLYPVELKIQGAGGHAIPHFGCMECFIELPFLPGGEIFVAAVVVPTTEYGLKVPVILGTNAIEQCREKCSEQVEKGEIPNEWSSAFLFLQQSRVGVVKSTNKTNIVIQPMETQTISGFVRKARNVEAAIKEHTEGASSRLGVCPRVVSLEKAGNYQRVPVKVFNMSAKIMTIKPNSNICELHDVKVMRTADPLSSETDKVNINQMAAEKEEHPTLPPGVNLDECAINDLQKEQLVQFLSKWKGVFSAGITDLGDCDLVQHEIKLQNDEPFKEPYRRIPPALFEEVREHLQEMIEAGAIRPSHSAYSSNVVLVRKKDGSLRFCVDFRRLNNRTIKDAYAIPRVEDSLHLLAGSKYFSKLDLRSGYWQVEIKEKDKHETAFQVGTLGFFEFNRMPFGLCNALPPSRDLWKGAWGLSICVTA